MTVLIVFPVIFQTVTNLKMLYIGEQGATYTRSSNEVIFTRSS